MVFKKLRKNSIKMNSKWLLLSHVLIVATKKVIKPRPTDNLPPENRELFLISKPDKIKNGFSLFRQQAANFQIYAILSERFVLTQTE